MNLSFRMEDTPANDEASKLVNAIATGSTVAVTVAKVLTDELEVTLVENPAVRCVISAVHLTDHRSHADALIKTFSVGDVIDAAAVVCKDGKRTKRLVLSCKPLLVAAATGGELPASVADLVEGTLYPGYVRSITAYGIFVGFMHGVVGLAMSKDLGEGVDPAEAFAVGQTVVAKLLKFNEETGRANLTLALSPAERASLKASHITSYFEEWERCAAVRGDDYPMAALRAGQCMRATVKSVKPYGVIVQVGAIRHAVVVRCHAAAHGRTVVAMVAASLFLSLSLSRPPHPHTYAHLFDVRHLCRHAGYHLYRRYVCRFCDNGADQGRGGGGGHGDSGTHLGC